MGTPVLRLKLLGDFRASVGEDQSVELPLKRARLLLAVLARSPSGRATREELMGLLWSERGEEQARQSLRQTLAVIRRALPHDDSEILISDGESVAIDTSAVATDVATFCRLARSDEPRDLETAAVLYSGEFLAGLTVRDPCVEDWLAQHRGELQCSLLRCLGTLLAAYTRRERIDDLEPIAARILELDPLDEAAHRALMAVHMTRGQRGLAFRQLQRCRDALRELAVAPSAETEALVRLPSANGRRTNKGNGGAIPLPKRRQEQFEVRRADIEPDSLARLPIDQASPRSRSPSLIVAPFEALGEGSRARLLAYGLVDDVVVDLSRFSSLFVVPPGPIVSLGLNPVDPVLVGSMLEVRYVLTGSVQAEGDRARVVAMLLDAGDGRTIWSERFDRRLDDMIGVRDELARQIAVAASTWADMAEYERLRRRDASDFGAWELCTLARRLFLDYTPEHNAEARALYARALALDPSSVRADVGLGWVHLEDVCFGWSKAPGRSLELAHEHAYRALKADQRHYSARYLLSYSHYFRRQFDAAVEECAQARTDNPNDPDLLFHEGLLLAVTGQAELGIGKVEEAMCLNPCHPDWFHYQHAAVALEAARYEACLGALNRYIDLHTGPFVGVKANALRLRVAAQVLCGRLDSARRDAKLYLAADPGFSVAAFARVLQRKEPASIERITSALRSAGLPA